MNDRQKSPDEINMRFPFLRLYFILISILTIFSLLGLSIQTDDVSTNTWKFAADLEVSSLTLILLFMAWLPLLIPWVVRLSPKLQEFFIGLRKSGLEEIEAGILKIKLSAGVQQAAETYENRVLEPSSTANSYRGGGIREHENTYQDTLKMLASAQRMSPREALERIDQLCVYYDRIRETIPSGKDRTRLMANVASTMWPLMASTRDFPYMERLKSSKGGERLSAYKYVEYKPNTECIDSLLSRALGVIETPFGQYNALLALRRVVSQPTISESQADWVAQSLRWGMSLDYMSEDRANLMNSVLAAMATSNGMNE